MYRKLFGYTPWAFIRLQIDDFPIPMSPGYVGFINICMGPFHKTFWLDGGIPNTKGSKIGQFLYRNFYNNNRAHKEFAEYWRWKNAKIAKSKLAKPKSA